MQIVTFFFFFYSKNGTLQNAKTAVGTLYQHPCMALNLFNSAISRHLAKIKIDQNQKLILMTNLEVDYS